MIFVVTGPSGAGKTTLVRQVLNDVDDVEFSASHTTRKKRNLEIEGKDYYFVSVEEFKRMIKEDRFAEWAVVHGNYYGTSKSEMEKKGAHKDIILDIDVQGAEQIRKRYKGAIFIFIMPPLFPELKRRLESRRDESKEAVKRRLETARKEMRFYPQFDYIIINDKLEEAAEELESVIRCSRCRFESRKEEVGKILRSFSEV